VPPPDDDDDDNGDRGGGGGGDDDDDDDEEVRESRITGTVVDQTTGRPMKGIRVRVGEEVVVTDENGNYDRSGLPEGKYRVELLLDPWQGSAAQEPLIIDLRERETVVQHLFYNSPPINATPPTADIIKMLMSKSEIVPRNLPDTSAPDGASASNLTAGRHAANSSSAPWGWLAIMGMLFALGVGLWHTGRHIAR
jgi:hypothetical protein